MQVVPALNASLQNLPADLRRVFRAAVEVLLTEEAKQHTETTSQKRTVQQRRNTQAKKSQPMKPVRGNPLNPLAVGDKLTWS